MKTYIGNSHYPGIVTGTLVTTPTPNAGPQIWLCNDQSLITPELLAVSSGLLLTTDCNPQTIDMCHFFKCPCISLSMNSEALIGQTVTLDGGYGALLPPYEIVRVTSRSPSTKTKLFSLTAISQESHSSPNGYGPIKAEHVYEHAQLQDINTSQKTYTTARVADYLMVAASDPDRHVLFQLSTIETENDTRIPDLWSLEIEAIKHARHKAINISTVFPLVRTLEQWKTLKKQLYFYGFKRTANCNFYLEIGFPSNVWQLEALIQDGLDGIIINVALLASRMLGLALNQVSPIVSIDLNNTVVLDAIEYCLKIAQKHQIQAIVTSPHIGFDKDLTQKIVKWGATGLAMDSDLIPHARENIYRNEINISKNKHRNKKK